MATTVSQQNNYSNFKEDFKKDTGLDASKNISEYINYYNARINDMNYQLAFTGANSILTSLNEIKILLKK